MLSQASPINMKHSLLVPERYAPNPQYSSCCGSEVPIISRDSVRFLDELGEGCFGKVYKGKRVLKVVYFHYSIVRFSPRLRFLFLFPLHMR